MEGETRTETTPRFGQQSQTDFIVLLKEAVNKLNPKIKFDKTEHHPKLNNSKNEKSSNSNKNLNLEKPPHINRELAIGRWFCDYPDKRLALRNDYDQDHSNKFLQEKEKAFEKLNLCDDLLLNKCPSNSNLKKH